MITQVFHLQENNEIRYKPFYERVYAPKWYHKIIRWLIKKSNLQEICEYNTIQRVDIQLDKIPSSIVKEICAINKKGYEAYTIIMGYDYYEKIIFNTVFYSPQLFLLSGDNPTFYGCSILCCPNITGFLVLPYKFTKS